MGASVGRAGLGLVGGAIGAYVTGGSPVGFAIGGMLGSILGSVIFPIEGPDVEGARLNDLTVQTSTYGNAIPIGYGTVRIGGNIIWASEMREQAVTTESGGKGGGGSTTTEYSYSIDVAIALAQGPIIGIKRVWANDKLVADYSDTPTSILSDKLRTDAYEDELRIFSMAQSSKVYLGTETQLPDPTIEAAVGVGLAPAHRGMAYVVINDLQLTSKEFGNRVPNFEFEVVFTGTLSNTSLLRTDDPTGGSLGYVDVDPMTGYIWATRPNTFSDDKIVVLSPNDLSLIAEIDHPLLSKPYQLTYQPSYVELIYDYTAGTSVPRKVRAHWWVGDAVPSGQVFRIDAESFQIVPISTGAGGFNWVGGVVWDDSYIDYLGANFPGLGRVIGWNTNGAGTYRRGAEPTSAVAAGFQYTIYVTGSIAFGAPSWVADWVQGKDSGGYGYIWMVDMKSQVYKMRREPSGVPLIDFLWVYGYALPGGVGTIGSQLNRLAYDYVNYELYTYTAEYPSGTWLTKYDEDLNEIWRIDYSGYGSVGGIDYHQGVGDVWLIRYNYATGMEIVKINPADGSDLEVILTDLPGFGYSDLKLYPGNPYAYIVQYGSPGGIRKVPLFNAPTSSPPTVETVVKDISQRCGLSLADIDAGELTDYVQGYVLSQQTTGRQAIENLQQTYWFDGVESDYIIKFPARGKSPTQTILYSEAGATPQADSPTSPIERQRDQDTELPRHVDVRYLDKDRSYKVTNQYARRLVGNSQRKTQMQVPIVLDATKAASVADIALYGRWMARDTATVSVSREWLNLDPSDVISFQDEQGNIDTFVITKTDYSIPNLIRMTMQRDDASIYTSNASSVAGPPRTETIPIVMPTRLYLMDIPILRDQDNNAGLYFAVSGVGSGWTVATIWKSSDEGVSYSLVQQTDRESVIGYARSTLTWEGGL